ncbi:aspartate--tRNA(Asn) ligase, partial [Candidatus Gracilibacteria bacterium]|nr:aspartate--tRNA(Asn) ligase [Candidatus Gracilibacteria bacterium]
NFKDLDFKTESFIEVSGIIKENLSVKLHGLELDVKEIKIMITPTEELPISWKNEGYPSLTERLDYRNISLREPKIHLVFEIMSFFEFKVREFTYKNKITEIHSPKILGAPSESGAELFELEYFDKKAYLAQSPQFYKQMGIASGFGKVMEVGPVFRADPSFTSRHMTEFIGLDFEISPIESHYDLMKFEEDFLVFIFSEIKKEFDKKIKELFGIEIIVPTKPFPKISFKEAVEILKKNYDLIISDQEDINAIGEKKLFDYIKKEFDHDFVFITEYPWYVRPFYHMKLEEDLTLTKSADLIYSGVEITTLAQREHRYEILKSQAIEKGLNLEKIQFYLDFFKYGIPPHGGMGLGMQRIFAKLFGFETIKEMAFIPRDPKRIFP